MKRTKNKHEKIYVKRLWIDKDEYDYIYITVSQYEEVKKSTEQNALEGKHNYMLLKQAPWWYPSYRYIKSNYKNAFWFIIGGIVTALIAYLFSKI